MQHNKNNPCQGEDADRDKAVKEYGGFLTTMVKEGDLVYIADAVIVIRKIGSNSVIIAIKAPKDQVIKKTEAKNG